mgnify:CR=1 FL=1
MYIYIFLIFCILLIIYLVYNKKKENYLGYGTTFGNFYKPIPNCKINNNCFPGYYFRSQEYSNLCEPQSGLLKVKKQLCSSCTRKH